MSSAVITQDTNASYRFIDQAFATSIVTSALDMIVINAIAT
jgi:hypothetical protein